MKITFVEPALPKTGSLVVGILEDRELTPTAADIDRRCGGALKRAMEFSRFRGKREQTLDVLVPPGLAIGRVVLVGLGKASELDDIKVEAVGGVTVAHLNRVGEKTATVAIDKIAGTRIAPAALAARVALGASLRAYRFDKYKTKEEKDKKPTLAALHIAVADRAGAERAYRPLEKVAEGVIFTRDLVSEPANIIYPETLAKAAKKLEKLGVDVEVLDEKAMAKLGMGALLGVGQGSARPPRLVVMQWHGAGKGKKPVAFIGKGVTFDTGGISIKPAASMEDMKWDMGGSGVVIGLMRALAGRKAKVNVVGVVGLVENMPSGKAQRPGDIVTSMSGQTIEVINTDAEGRLVLADALWYTQDRFKPQFMVNLATLTGAIIIALGSEHAGLFANNETLVERLVAAGKQVGELLWRLPLADAYDKDIESDAADMKNVGSGRGAGSITAAQFLQRFVNKVPWAHLDIAGTTWSKKDKPTVPKGATAFGLRLLDRFLQEHYEGK
jgi:leucyl aminopeptidase